VREGPDGAGRHEEALNPFLPKRDDERAAAWVAQLSDLDPEAAEFLAAAFRAERAERWYEPELALARYGEAWVKNAEYLHERGAEARERLSLDFAEVSDTADGRFESEVDQTGLASTSPDDVLDECEVRLTRLMLVGHGPTTRYILPELLAISTKDEHESTLLEVQEVQVALSRFRPFQRLAVATDVLRIVASGRLAQRDRIAKVKSVIAAFGGPADMTRLAILMTTGAAVPGLQRLGRRFQSRNTHAS
jgi:hypothetical protein